ncbi:hypothetical protein [Paenibacillus nanensis]|nr:hypothetical protein [Paenibacillus nanensis]
MYPSRGNWTEVKGGFARISILEALKASEQVRTAAAAAAAK